MALEGTISLTVSQHILGEMTGVLARKFYATPEEIAEATRIVLDAARVVAPAVRLDVVAEDPADNRILECAVAAGSQYIVTGDKDLLRLGSYDSIKILTVSGFLKVGSESGFGSEARI